MADIPEGFEFVPKAPPIPKGFEEVPVTEFPEPEPSIGGKVVQRFLGTDVEDPQEFTRMGPIIAGAFAGGYFGAQVTPKLPGMAGFVVNPITGALLFGAAGSALGAAAPEGVMDVGEMIGAFPPGTREKHGLSPEDLKTVMEGEALLDLATGGGITFLRLTGRGTVRLMSGVSREIAEAATRQGIPLMPVQVGNRVLGKGFVAVLGRFPFLGAPIRKTGQATEKAMRKAVEGLPARFAPLASWSTISDEIFTNAKTLVQATDTRFRKLYGDLWQRANEMGVRSIPAMTLKRSDEILAKLEKARPVTAAELVGKEVPETTIGKVSEKVAGFIRENVLVMREKIPGGTAIAHQPLKQMDELLSKIDQEIASFEPGQKRYARSLFNQLRQAVQLDMLANLRGAQADEIGRQLKAIDADFSVTMSQLFETSAAKKFGSVARRGLRGVATDPTTRMSVDKLADLVVKIDEPKTIDELSRLVTPDTFNRIAAKVFDDAYSKAYTTGKQFNVERFAKSLGLDAPTSSRYLTIESMLAKTNTGVTMEMLDDLVVAGRAIADLEIPDVSAFIARRATLGGLRGFINGMVPGMVLATGTGAAAYAGGSLLAIGTFIGGSRLISSILANPLSAQALKTVMRPEATRIVKRTAVVNAIRTGLNYMWERGELTFVELERLRTTFEETLEAYDSQVESMEE